MAGPAPPNPGRSKRLALKPQRNVDREQRTRGPMDKASACGSGGCRFESCPGHSHRLARRARRAQNKAKRVTTVGFEPTPLRAGASSQRLRSHGQAAVMADASGKKTTKKTSRGGETPKRRQREWPLWGSSPRPCWLAPEASALDHSAQLARGGHVRSARGQQSKSLRAQRSRSRTPVGHEPTQLARLELESTPLDHAGKLSRDLSPLRRQGRWLETAERQAAREG
jgi:hypothetical protein